MLKSPFLFAESRLNKFLNFMEVTFVWQFLAPVSSDTQRKLDQIIVSELRARTPKQPGMTNNLAPHNKITVIAIRLRSSGSVTLLRKSYLSVCLAVASAATANYSL